MWRWSGIAVAACVSGLAFGGVARADGAAGQADEPGKQLLQVDAYLTDAIAHARAVYQTAQLRPGALDAALEKQALADVDRALDRAIAHVGAARIGDSEPVARLRAALQGAKGTVARLALAVRRDARPELERLSSALATQLATANDALGELAVARNVTRIEAVRVPERQPVSGHDDDAARPPTSTGTLDRDDTFDKGELHERSNRNARDRLEPTVPAPSTPGPGH